METNKKYLMNILAKGKVTLKLFDNKDHAKIYTQDMMNNTYSSDEGFEGQVIEIDLITNEMKVLDYIYSYDEEEE